HRSINDAGQITLLLQVGGGDTATSLVVLSTARLTSQTIAFAALTNHTFGDTPLAVTATASSGLPVTFAASGACSVADGTVTLLHAEVCTITASQAGDATYLPASDVSQTFTIVRAGQTIAFALLPDRTLGDPPFSVIATTSSGLPASFAASGNCTIAAGIVTPTSGGSCTVTASQGGGADYEPAPDVSRVFAIARAGQTITFEMLADRTFGDPPFTVTATASSGLAVTFSATGSCSRVGDLTTLIAAGPCASTASQAGDASSLPAPPATRAFGPPLP